MEKSNSLIHEIQMMASDSSVPLSTVLKRAYLAASKLDQKQTSEFIGFEISGYNDYKFIPKYRVVCGELFFEHPMYGKRPILIPDKKINAHLSKVYIADSIGAIEQLLSSDSSASIVWNLSPEDNKLVWDGLDDTSRRMCKPFKEVGRGVLAEIIDNVRQLLLDWSLSLERQGIMGEGMTFSNMEKQSAGTIISIGSIQHMNGAIGSFVNSSINLPDITEIHTQIVQAGIDEFEAARFMDMLNAAREGTPEKQREARSTAQSWLVKNAVPLGSLAVQLAQYISDLR